MSINADTIRAAAQHRWHGILTALGVPSESLRNQHQPCPLAVGVTFRFDDQEGRSTFVCSHFGNGGGDGFHFVMHLLDCDFATALIHVAGVLGLNDAAPKAKSPLRPRRSPQSKFKISGLSWCHFGANRNL